jgi:hypothetical protein
MKIQPFFVKYFGTEPALHREMRNGPDGWLALQLAKLLQAHLHEAPLNLRGATNSLFLTCCCVRRERGRELSKQARSGIKPSANRLASVQKRCSRQLRMESRTCGPSRSVERKYSAHSTDRAPSYEYPLQCRRAVYLPTHSSVHPQRSSAGPLLLADGLPCPHGTHSWQITPSYIYCVLSPYLKSKSSGT